GDVRLDDLSVVEDPERARSLIGFVPDELRVYWDTTVHEYVDFFARAFGLKGSTRDDAVAGVEEFTGTADIRDKQLRALSKGMKQRVSLARALVSDPQVLILDEPAAGLDPRARVELRELLVLLADQGKAVFISSHILTELTEICHGVVIIEQGRILETGEIDAVIQKQAPKRTYAIRVVEFHDRLVRDLMQFPYIDHPRPAGNEVHFEVEGTEDNAFEVLNLLINHGYRVVEFRQTKANLEDIFMNVTEGHVQ
ncbi:MAG: ABC transporter ATP-binding protein, partial [Verrucomicrobiota bacterium]|nr:ABC transporter ATP-binding protein [Verrucomicrobiota bacterium]